MEIYGYLDAGTGSIVLQAIIGGTAAAAVAAKFYWQRILVFLRIRSPEPTDVEDSEGDQPTPGEIPR